MERCLPNCKVITTARRVTTNGKAGIVLLGDAVHAFPPDIGEGINCALQDVAALDDALTEHSDNIADALEAFENERLPEVRQRVL